MERTMFGCSVIDDLIGAESGASMTSDLEEAFEAKPLNNRATARPRSSAVTRQYPPPMNRNSWILKREYFDGRLVLKARRVKSRQHFEVRRENGRLVMTLVVSEQEEQRVEVNEEAEEEGTDVTCDELENENNTFNVFYDGYVEMGLELPVRSWVVQDSTPSRPVATAM